MRPENKQGVQIMTIELSRSLSAGRISGVQLTNEHAASSYGIPVLVVDGQAYGRGDNVIATREDGSQYEIRAMLVLENGTRNLVPTREQVEFICRFAQFETPRCGSCTNCSALAEPSNPESHEYRCPVAGCFLPNQLRCAGIIS
jgi:hypothetical protein